MSGALAGVTLGYNYQTGVWVWGLEGDLDASWIKGSTTVNCGGTCETKNSWLGTARGRIGYAWDRWMPYITGGAAFGNVKVTDAFGSGSATKIGWTAGLGLEYAFWSNWSTKVEYLYVDLGKTTCAAPSCGLVDVSGTYKANLVRLGVNYRF
jgi:outer membrane immunogenic protein